MTAPMTFIKYQNQVQNIKNFFPNQHLRNCFKKIFKDLIIKNDLLIIKNCENVCGLLINLLNNYENKQSLEFICIINHFCVFKNIFLYKEQENKNTNTKLFIEQFDLEIVEFEEGTTNQFYYCKSKLESSKLNKNEIITIDNFGHFYVAKNIKFLDNIYKIGFTKIDDINIRMMNLSKFLMLPGRFEEILHWEIDDCISFERDVLNILDNFNCNISDEWLRSTELFEISLDKIINVVQELIKFNELEFSKSNEIINFLIDYTFKIRFLRKKCNLNDEIKRPLRIPKSPQYDEEFEENLTCEKFLKQEVQEIKEFKTPKLIKNFNFDEKFLYIRNENIEDLYDNMITNFISSKNVVKGESYTVSNGTFVRELKFHSGYLEFDHFLLVERMLKLGFGFSKNVNQTLIFKGLKIKGESELHKNGKNVLEMAIQDRKNANLGKIKVVNRTKKG